MLRVRPAALLTEPACLGRELDAPHVLVGMLPLSDTAQRYVKVAAAAGDLDLFRETAERLLEQHRPPSLNDRRLHAARSAARAVDQLEQVRDFAHCSRR